MQGYASDSTDVELAETLRDVDLSLIHSSCEADDNEHLPEDEDRIAQLWRCTVAAVRSQDSGSPGCRSLAQAVSSKVRHVPPSPFTPSSQSEFVADLGPLAPDVADAIKRRLVSLEMDKARMASQLVGAPLLCHVRSSARPTFASPLARSDRSETNRAQRS